MSPRPLRQSPFVDQLVTSNLTTLVSKTNHRDAILYLHGFPGPYESRATDELRLADEVFEVVRLSFDFYYPLYALKPPGAFRFLGTLADARTALELLLARAAYRSVTIVGQSWGAVLAAELCRHFTPTRLILITPFVRIPRGDVARGLIQSYAKVHPNLLSGDQYLEEIETIAREHNPVEIVKTPPCPLTIIAAERDEVVPLNAIESIQTPARLIVLPGQTHQIEDRTRLIDELKRLLT